MAKVKYYFDPRTLAYRKIDRTWRQRLTLPVVFVLLFATGFFLATFTDGIGIESPKDKEMKRELDNMVLQYEIMNQRLNQLTTVLNDMQNRDDNIYRVIFEADPIPNEVRQAGFGGANRYKNLEGYSNSDLIVQTRKKLDVLTKQAYVQSKSFDEVLKMAKDKDKMLQCIPAIQPVSNTDLRRMASGFGYRIHPVYKVPKMHTGLDFSAPTGTPIYATGDGKVVNDEAAGAGKVGGSGYGNYVVIDHGYGYKTLYAHMSKVAARPGQKVKRGDIIGYVGSTGTSTAPHLHYEVVKNGEKINPINFFYNDLTPEEYELMIQLSTNSNQSFD